MTSRFALISPNTTAAATAPVKAPTPVAPERSRMPSDAGSGPAEHPDAFKPLSREDVSEILGISIRTLENWVKQHKLPAPCAIGGRRYWHPQRFYKALDVLLQQTSDNDSDVSFPRRPSGKEPDRTMTASGRRARQSTQSAADAMLREAKERAKLAGRHVAPSH